MSSENRDNDTVAHAACERRVPISAPPSVSTRRRAPSVMLGRVCGPLSSLLACGIARHGEGGVVDLFLSVEEAAQGGMAMISMWVPVRKAQSAIDELFSAWLAVSPGVADDAIVTPSVFLPGMIQPVRFRIHVHPNTTEPNKAPEQMPGSVSLVLSKENRNEAA